LEGQRYALVLFIQFRVIGRAQAYYPFCGHGPSIVRAQVHEEPAASLQATRCWGGYYILSVGGEAIEEHRMDGRILSTSVKQREKM